MFVLTLRDLNNSDYQRIQLTMTASTLYEAVEPQILWKYLLSALFAEIEKDSAKDEVCSNIYY